MYTIQFGSRAHFIGDDAAQAVLSAIEAREQFVTVEIDLAADGGENYTVTLNVAHIIAFIKHRAADITQKQRGGPVKLALVQ